MTPHYENVTVRCPVDHAVSVVWLGADDGELAWCKRSGLAVLVPPHCAHVCPLMVTTAPIPDAAKWACPLGPSGKLPTN